MEGSDGLQCNDHGKCLCKKHVTGDKCDECETGYKGHPKCDSCDSNFFDASSPSSDFPDCKACSCDEQGSIENSICDVASGACECKPNITGKHCTECISGFYGFPNCTSQYQQIVYIGVFLVHINLNFPLFIDCECKPEGSNGCDKVGQCICLENIEGKDCGHCADNFFGYPNCTGI